MTPACGTSSGPRMQMHKSPVGKQKASERRQDSRSRPWALTRPSTHLE